MLSFFEVAIGEGEVLACARCGAEKSAATAHELEVVSTRLEEYSGAASGVAFIGFEPFAHPALPDIIAAAVDAGFVRIMLRTDAGALGVGGNADGAVAAGVTHIEVVLLGDESTHDRLAGVPGLFASAAAGVSAFTSAAERQGAAVFVSGLLPLCEHNLQSAPAAVAAFASLGASAVRLDASDVEGADSMAAIEAALDTATVNRMHGWVCGPRAFSPPSDRGPWQTLGAEG